MPIAPHPKTRMRMAVNHTASQALKDAAEGADYDQDRRLANRANAS